MSRARLSGRISAGGISGYSSPATGRGRAWRPGENPFYDKPVYTANLCPLSGEAEFANLEEDFGEAIRKPIEAASRRAIRQGPTEHLDGVLSEEQRVDDAVKAGTGRNCWRLRLWN